MQTFTKYLYAVVDVNCRIANYAYNRDDARYIKQDAEKSDFYKRCGYKAPFKIIRYSNPEVVR